MSVTKIKSSKQIVFDANSGHAYYVTVGGKIGGASGTTVIAGQLLICNVDNSLTGTQAAVGANWEITAAGTAGAVTSTSSSVTDNSITRMDSTSGSVIQTSLATIDDNGSINIPAGQSFKINSAALTQDNIPDGVTNKAYTATEQSKLSGIEAGANSKATVKGDYIVREVPTGTKNGSNATFTLANTPVSGTEMLFLNGILQNAGSGNDYTISTNTITMLTGAIPVSTDVLLCTYFK